ncbi:MAG: hypothetical protein KJ579_02995 [Verrucomicrobia bacterium]|nr:hypothetical protein [Verrucomicrobiota bacterium]
MNATLPLRLSILGFAVAAAGALGAVCEPWQSPYAGGDVTGRHVIACWRFAPGAELKDSGPNGHDLKVQGAGFVADGRFGGALEPTTEPQVLEKKHGVLAADHSALSPAGAFTLEAWICPGVVFTNAGEAFILDKKYAGQCDYQFTLSAPDKAGRRSLTARLGFGGDSEAFISDPGTFATGAWTHVAFTYDGDGRGRFYVDGSVRGGRDRPGRASVVPGALGVTLGDRTGSNHRAFPGRIAQVRICSGVLEFRRAAAGLVSGRTSFIRMEPAAVLRIAVTNFQRTQAEGVAVAISVDGSARTNLTLPAIAPGAVAEASVAFDTTLRPGTYRIGAILRVPGSPSWTSTDSFDLTLVPRPPPFRMPVVMWGGYSPEGALKDMPRMKDLGFTHCLGLGADYVAIRKAGTSVAAGPPALVEQTERMLNEALAQDFGILATLSPGSALKNETGLLRVNARGEPQTNRPDICALSPGVKDYCRNVGESVARAYGRFPAFQGALLHTEVRDHAFVCRHEHDRAACRAAAGVEIPDNLAKNGRRWEKIEGFPANRVVADNDPTLACLRWFWKEGDGWNGLNTAIYEGLRAGGVRPGFWTFHDPAVRVASTWGSGGAVDVLSQWTYSYPDPIRIGLATDELFAMARGAKTPQRVMKMTQIIWYRSQTAPARTGDVARAAAQSPWEDTDPDAAFVTISPMHLREAFWTKMARPIQGIMYHGWQSLVQCGGNEGYRFTHPETQHELRRLVHEVVQPLGPALMQVPDAPADVAFLESFASQMLAGRGTYGWGHTWSGDAWHVLQYAHLQPEVVYDETVLRDGLDRFKVLCLFDCDVLTESVAARILAFQKKGGLVVGDERLAPAIRPDFVIESYTRTRKADEDRQALVDRAGKLGKSLAGRYTRAVESNRDLVIPRLRRYGTTDYLFAVNDSREFGTYVGQHGLVMENGLPLAAEIALARPAGHVYDLVEGAAADVGTNRAGCITVAREFGPCEGRVYMITDRPIAAAKVEAPASAKRGGTATIRISVVDPAGKPIGAVVPVRVDIRDPDGREAERSGWYGAKDGVLDLRLDFAANDTPGTWEIRVRELASSRRAAGFLTLRP